MLRPARARGYHSSSPPRAAFVVFTHSSSPGEIPLNVTDNLTEAFRRALARHGMPEPRGVVWQVPRGEHGADYATPSAMAYAKQHGLDAGSVVAMVVAELEALPEVANA